MAVPDHPAKNRYFEPDAGERLLDKQRAPFEEMPTSSFQSSNVHSGLYDFGERQLWMRYLRRDITDALYRYDDVPAREWQGLKEATSKGSYINANVAFEYRYTRLNISALPVDERRGEMHQMVRRFVTAP
jgi:hypothetical protein